MSDGEEWGPWVEHDGRGCPCRGMVVESEERRGLVEVHIAGGIGSGGALQWNWDAARRAGYPIGWQIIRYRIRKPRGLTILENLIADLPAPVQPEAVPA